MNRRAREKEKRKNNAPDQFAQEDFFVRVERLLLLSREERERESQFLPRAREREREREKKKRSSPHRMKE